MESNISSENFMVLARISHHLTTEARDKLAITSLHLLIVLTVLFLEEALSLAREKGMLRTETGVLCRRALLPDGDTKTALEVFTAKQDQLGPPEQMSARFLLFRATKDEAHLAEAKRLLDFLVQHAPEEHRETMLSLVDDGRLRNDDSSPA